ncbi:PREDICTED: probable tRNA (uracil-O(2)-)-methyltransferase [Cyphomyrmex costatus]|uniref:tRNA (uracil-O(2)-)-methyltransferase n=1 Tax=Cyphomyrmex costatus TaxID=456900 RepID=A0A195CS06_9HYME|nr:PREDICTED: probable tRNA (uracil-O(2)-)-methyltransferase [Cyphomyrmex costatus]KYN03277.1 putative tRNA (uracil-O(2)-)-methyltransferase [Cyphomyrmex costatus]
MRENFEEVVSEATNSSNLQFWKAIGIWTRNPHIINRRILASQELLTVQVSCNVVNIFEHVEKLKIQPEDFECDSSSGDIKCLLDTLGIAEYCQVQTQYTDPIESMNDDKIYLCVKKLLPRNTQIFSPTLELVLVDKGSVSVTSFYKPIVLGKQSLGLNTIYRIQHREYASTCINVCKSDNDNYGRSCDWLKSKFFPRFLKWMDSENDSVGQRISSLSLISVEKYTLLYNRLKDKYGTRMVNVWPENTDPFKFVYEDVAIATYLLLLWEKERLERKTQKLQSFVDLGCGNGLLVYILSSEGHAGTGIDLRRRKIWDLFPESTHLQVDTIVPSWDTVFPNVDWIIGNHSDELTPWIPVIAARSSYECRFFLLPCCAYEFDGSKYRRCNAAESQYSEYMSYVKSVCEGCGFLTLVDRLRIPSTKRTCFVGWKRTCAKENTTALDADIQRIINARSQVESSRTKAGDGELWSTSFKPRDSTEQTRNCTQLDKGLILEIVNVVVAHLLHVIRRISLERKPGKTWNAGGQIGIGEMAKLIAPEMLQQLRNECGGLQTLLKNHSHIFCVAQGKVQFRIPGTVDKKKKRRKNGNASAPLRKVKPCWFHKNHPDGCPALEIDCDFQH